MGLTEGLTLQEQTVNIHIIVVHSLNSPSPPYIGVEPGPLTRANPDLSHGTAFLQAVLFLGLFSREIGQSLST